MSLTVDQCIQKAYTEATGKSTTLAAGTNKYNRLVVLADDLSKTWQNEDGTDWNSLYSLEDIGTVTATDTFSLDEAANTIRKLSHQEGDSVYITATDGRIWYYDIVEAPRLKDYPDSVAVIGRNLVFGTAFTSTSSQYGATITVPAFIEVDDITTSTTANEVQVDDPMWLVYMMAAEYDRNDQVKQNQYPNLINKANDRMNAMKRANGSQIEEVVIEMDLTTSGETWT